jgi:hypothetical protein
MGAFYVLDPRASTAATALMRQGIEVYKLKKDVVLPSGSTYKFYGLDGNGNRTENWGVRKNKAEYVGVYSTKMPRPRSEIRNNYSAEANLISPNFQTSLAGVPWVPLTDAQMPPEADAPTYGGGEWFETPVGQVAKAGYYVIPTTQKWARYAAFQLEPRANCGLLFWAHLDDAVTSVPDKFDLDLVKTFDYAAISASDLERLVLAEDENKKPEDTFAPPYLDLDGDFSSLTDEGATIVDTTQSKKTEKITVTIKDACLHDGMWLTFFFYKKDTSEPIPILKQVFEGEAPGTYKAVFDYMELKKEGLRSDNKYFIHYSNEMGDIFGYGTLTKGALNLEWDLTAKLEDMAGCNATFGYLAFIFMVPFVFRKR